MRVASLRRYPLKGLPGEDLRRATVRPGVGIPGDRALALKLAGVAPGWQGKHLFLQLCNLPLLATLQVELDEAAGSLRVTRAGRILAEAAGPDDVARVEGLFSGLAAQAGIREVPVTLERLRFPDQPGFDLSLAFSSSIRELGRLLGRELAPERFRMNILLDGEGTEPFQEAGLVGRTFHVGTARIRISEPLPRCPAPDVNPDTGQRDVAILEALFRFRNTRDLGVMAKVEEAGEIPLGARLLPVGCGPATGCGPAGGGGW